MTNRILFGLCLSLIHVGTAAADTKAFAGARIFDGTGKAVIEKGTIVVVDGKIAAAGPSNKVKAPKGAQTIDVSGKDAVGVKLALRSRGINTSSADRKSGVLDMDEKRASTALRLSPHYYNTEDELDTAVAAIAELAGG